MPNLAQPSNHPSQSNPPYRGRFAPTPSGPLHFGSLVTAVASFLQAKHHQGKWLLRIDDIDHLRHRPNAITSILTTLEKYQLFWDETIGYQQQYLPHYAEYLDQLTQTQQIYPCYCSRRTVANTAIEGDYGPLYPGTCRHLSDHSTSSQYAIRLKTTETDISFTDKIQGAVKQNMAQQVGDFIIKRADNIFAYPLAVVIDDYLQGVTEVVRGCDLLTATPRQIFIQQLLNFPSLSYAHMPIITNGQHQKLSKREAADPIDQFPIKTTLLKVFKLLDHPPPDDLQANSLTDIWQWAQQNWHINQVTSQKTIAITDE